MIFKKSSYINLGISLLGAFLYAIAHPTKLNIPPLGPLSVLVGYLLISYSILSNQKRPVLYILLTYLLLYFFSLDWLASSLQILSPIPYFFCYIICFFWTFLLVPTLWFPYLLKINRKLPYLKNYSLIKNVIIPSLFFSFLENLLSFNLEIFIGSSWIVFPNATKVASLFGPKYFSFLIFASVFSILDIYESKKNQLTNKPQDKMVYIIFLILLVYPMAIPSSLIHKDVFDKNIKVRIVQPNSSNKKRLAAEKGKQKVIDQILDDLIKFSTLPTEGPPLNLIIWPEVAYPYGLFLSDDKKSLKGKLPYTLERYFNRRQIPLLFGGYIKVENAKSKVYQNTFNSALHFDSFGRLKQYYNKKYFVPFGEDIPLIGHLKWTQDFFTSTSYFARGKNYPIFKGPESSNFITTLCFEVLFTSYIRTYLNQNKDKYPSYIVNLTNDSWLLDSAGPKHHLFLTRWRAIEFKTPIIRANNSGVSTIIYSDGSLGKRIAYNTSDYLDISFKVDSKRRPTIYQNYGDIPYFIFIFLLSFIGMISPKKS